MGAKDKGNAKKESDKDNAKKNKGDESDSATDSQSNSQPASLATKTPARGKRRQDEKSEYY